MIKQTQKKTKVTTTPKKPAKRRSSTSVKSSAKNKRGHKKITAKTERRLKAKKKFWFWFIPHEINSFKPRVIGRYGAMVLVALVIALQFGYNYTKTGSVLGRVSNITPAALLASTNDERKSNNLEPLIINDKLSAAAAQKANDMLTKGYWSHDSPDGVKPWAWVESNNYSYTEAGENLAKNFTTAGSTVTAWMNSPSHRENVLNPNYQEVGFATVDGEMNGEPTTITVAFYGKPANVAVLAGATEISPTMHVATSSKPINIITRIGLGLQSLTPAAVTALALLFVAITIAIVSHSYRSQLPKKQRESWRRNHAVFKSSGFFVIAAFVVLLYGGGSL